MNEHSKRPVLLSTGELTIEEVVGVARFGWQVAPVGAHTGNAQADAAFARMEASRRWVEDETNRDNPRAVYGINTGFGIKAGDKPLSKNDVPWVSRNLIVSHATGVGNYLHPEIVRAAMLIRANSLALGYSGVRVEIVNKLVEMLNRGVCPAIPEYGSVGSSGDLAPLAHLALAFSQRPDGGLPLDHLPPDYEDEAGLAYLDKRHMPDAPTALVTEVNDYRVEYALLPAHQAMQAAGIDLITLGPKEGLALTNGATFSAAIAALALYDAENIARHAEIGTALALEALVGFRDAFLPAVHKVRHHQGQIKSAARVYAFVQGSTLVDGDVDKNPHRTPPQDPYSLRVAPQVIGAAWDVLQFVRATLTREINAATDNPLIFPEGFEPKLDRDYRVVSGGNFHGTPIGYAMDFLSIVMTDLGSLSERRIFRLTDDKLNRGLPLMLVQDEEGKEGRTSGMMMPQVLAAALVSDCKTLAHPASVDSIPTSANQEDHTSMSMNAAQHARKIAENIERVVAIELLCAFLGLKWRLSLEPLLKNPNFPDPQKSEADYTLRERAVRKMRDWGISALRPGTGSRAALEVIQESLYASGTSLPQLGERPTIEDRYLRPYMVRMTDLVKNGVAVRRVYKECGIESPRH